MWSHVQRARGTRPHRQSSLTLAGQTLLLQLVLVTLVLGFVTLLALNQATIAFTDERGSRMRSVAENLSNVPVVRSEMGESFAAQTLASTVDQAKNLSGASDISLADPQGQIIASSDPSRLGNRVELGDSQVIKGRGWTGTVKTERDRFVAGHAPILSDDGRLIGLAIAEQEFPTIWQRISAAGASLLLYVGLGALFGVGGSVLLSRLIKKRTQGLQPDEIAALADHREALLHNIREGVIALDDSGRVTMINDGAAELLGIDSGIMGQRIDQVGLADSAVKALTSAEDLTDALVVVGDRIVVLNRRPTTVAARRAGKNPLAGAGTVTTLRDRTELNALESRLTSTLSITDTLRSQTHEFANQLHTISGLLQMGEHDEVRDLIGQLTRHRAAQSDFVTARLRDRAVAALVIAKSSVAAEAAVKLTLDPSSRLSALPPEFSVDLTTVIGNLIDNGIDAVRGSGEGKVSLLVIESPTDLLIRVVDNGPGVPANRRAEIFTRGVTTKPNVPGGRGIGLPLARLLVEQRGGTIAVTDGTSGGAMFSATLPIHSIGNERNYQS